MNNLVTIGMVVVFLGIALVVIGSLTEAKQTKFAVGGLIGPIPFGFANDKTMFYFVMGLTGLVFVLWLVTNLVR